MSAQPLRHERFAQAPPLQSRLDLPALDKLKPDAGRRHAAHRNRPANHSSPIATARGITGKAAPSIDWNRLQNSHAIRSSKSRRLADWTVMSRGGAAGPNGLCILEPKLERGRRNWTRGLISIVGVGDARHPMPALASKPVGRPAGGPALGCPEDTPRIHQDGMIIKRTIAPHDQTSPNLWNYVFSRQPPRALLSHGPLRSRQPTRVRSMTGSRGRQAKSSCSVPYSVDVSAPSSSAVAERAPSLGKPFPQLRPDRSDFAEKVSDRRRRILLYLP